MDESTTDNQSQDKNEPEDIKQKLSDCEKQRDEYLAGWQRAKADFVNYKKDEAQRLQEFAKYAAADFARDLIAVLDSFELGLRALEKQGPVEKGIYMIKSQLEEALRQRGVERIKVKAGDKFDPAVMETIAEVESDQPEGVVVEEIEAGWRMYDKILRPARVKVAKQKLATSQ